MFVVDRRRSGIPKRYTHGVLLVYESRSVLPSKPSKNLARIAIRKECRFTHNEPFVLRIAYLRTVKPHETREAEYSGSIVDAEADPGSDNVIALISSRRRFLADRPEVRLGFSIEDGAIRVVDHTHENRVYVRDLSDPSSLGRADPVRYVPMNGEDLNGEHYSHKDFYGVSTQDSYAVITLDTVPVNDQDGVVRRQIVLRCLPPNNSADGGPPEERTQR